MNYNNKTEITESIQMYDLGLKTNYTVTTDEPSQVILDNRTTTLDQRELISYRCHNVGTVNTSLNIQYPARVRSGVSYAAQIEETVVEIDEILGRQDHPHKMYLTIVHDMSSVVSNEVLNETFSRLISSLPRTVADGKVVIDFLSLARGGLRPQG